MRRLLAWGCWLGTSVVLAQAPPPSSEDLSAQATDPTASLMSFQFLDWYTPSYHGTDDSSNQLVFRAAIPFEMLGLPNILRVTLPYATSSPSGQSGLGDTQVFNLTVFGAPWGRWGVGLAGSLPTGRDGLSSEKWTVGPAAGFVNSSSKGYNFGLFAQTFFSLQATTPSPMSASSTCSRSSASNSAVAVRSRSATAPWCMTRRVTLGFAGARRELRAGHQSVGPEVAAERRGRL